MAIARAIVTDPKIVVADEPTGDSIARAADEILDAAREAEPRVRARRSHGHARPGRGRARQLIRRLDKGGWPVTLWSWPRATTLRNKFRACMTVLGARSHRRFVCSAP